MVSLWLGSGTGPTGQMSAMMISGSKWGMCPGGAIVPDLHVHATRGAVAVTSYTARTERAIRLATDCPLFTGLTVVQSLGIMKVTLFTVRYIADL